MRLAFFQKEEESSWQSISDNPHFRQGITAILCLLSLLFKLKKWQLYTAKQEFNPGKAHGVASEGVECRLSRLIQQPV